MAHALQPATYQQAVAQRRSAQRLKVLFAIFEIVGVVMVIGLSRLFDEIPATARWVLAATGVGLVVAGSIGADSATGKVRYRVRIGRVRSAVARISALTGILACAWAIGLSLPDWRLNALRALLVVTVVAQSVAALKQVTLLDGDCDGVRFRLRGNPFRRVGVGWGAISQVVFTAGSKGRTIEVGLRTRSPQAAIPLPPRRGEILTDLPYRVVVPQKSFDLRKVQWMLNQSGRRDVALVERTPAGERELGYANSWP